MFHKRFLTLLVVLVMIGLALWLVRPWFSNGMLRTIYAIVIGLAIVYIIGNMVAYSAIAKRYGTCRLRTIDAQELYKKMQNRQDIDVINVLSEQYYRECHIEASRNIPLASLAAAATNWDKNKEIIVYCSSYECQASRKAYDLLCSLGFTNVHAYEGGIREWKELGLPTEGTCK